MIAAMALAPARNVYMARSTDVKSTAFYKQKDGVAKTVSALVLSRGFKILMIDAEVQNKTQTLTHWHKLSDSTMQHGE